MPDDVPDELRGKDFEILQTGRWWIVELEDPKIAAQGESREEALDKLVKQLEKYQGRRDQDSKRGNRSRERGTPSLGSEQVAYSQ